MPDDKEKTAAAQAKRRQTLIRQRATRRYRSYPPRDAAGAGVKILDAGVTLGFFGNPEVRELIRWLEKNSFEGIRPAEFSGPGQVSPDTVMAAGLKYAMHRYSEAADLDVCSFATLVQRLVTGQPWGFATADYPRERQAELLILAAAGALPPPSDGITALPVDILPTQTPDPEFTRGALAFLEEFYFQDVVKALQAFTQRLRNKAVAGALLALAQAAADQADIVGMVGRGEIMTTVQVSKEYGLASRNVVEACKQGRLGQSAADITATWLITRAAAHREWGYRLVKAEGPATEPQKEPPAVVSRRVTTALFNKRGKFEFQFAGSIAELIARHGSGGAIVWEHVGKIQEVDEEKRNPEL